MARPHTKIAIGTAVFVVLTALLLVLSMRQQARVTCEVCVTFRGRTQCRAAVGPTEKEAVRTAVDNACAFLASGMTDSISCSNTPPDSVTCER